MLPVLARVMPNHQSNGHIHLNFVAHPPPTTDFGLSLLQPSHFPLGVIGIGTCSKSETRASALNHFNSTIQESFPRDSIYPLARNCFLFDTNDGSESPDLTDDVPGSVVIPAMMGNKQLYIGTLLADLCSVILGELGRIVSHGTYFHDYII